MATPIIPPFSPSTMAKIAAVMKKMQEEKETRDITKYQQLVPKNTVGNNYIIPTNKDDSFLQEGQKGLLQPRTLTKNTSELEDEVEIPTNNERYKRQLNDVYESQLGKPTLLQKTAPYAKAIAPALIPLGSLLANLGFIKRSEEHSLSGMKPIAFNTGQAPVPVVKGLPSEVLAAHNAAAAGLQPKKTSDATYNAMTEQMTFAQKLKAQNDLATLQAQDLDAQRKTQLQVQGQNAMNAANAMNKEAEYNAQIEKEKGLIAAQADAERRNAINKLAGETIEMFARRKEDKDIKALSASEYEYNKLVNELSAIQSHKKLNPYDKSYDDRYNMIMKSLSDYNKIPTAKKGKKLIRKKCK